MSVLYVAISYHVPTLLFQHRNPTEHPRTKAYRTDCSRTESSRSGTDLSDSQDAICSRAPVPPPSLCQVRNQTDSAMNVSNSFLLRCRFMAYRCYLSDPAFVDRYPVSDEFAAGRRRFIRRTGRHEFCSDSMATLVRLSGDNRLCIGRWGGRHFDLEIGRWFKGRG